MGLQIRLRHALGERVVEVRPRSIDLPLVIGRSKESDLQIPSVTVAARHCVLFVHDGQWVAQDLAGATSLNDVALSGPAALHVGDVLTIGAGNSPATIEIDPAGVEAGRTGAPASEMMATPLPVAAPVRAAVASRMPQAVGISAYGQSTRPMGRMMPAAPPPPPPTTAVAEEDEDAVGWGLPADPGSQRFYVPRRKQNHGPMIAFGLVAACVIIGGAIAIVRYLQPPPAPPAAPPPKVVEEEVHHFKNMFDVPDGGSSPTRAPATPRPQRPTPPADNSDDNSGSSSSPPPNSPPVSSAAPGAPASSSGDSDSDPDADDPDINEVEGAVVAGDPATAILKMDDYAQKHPGKNQARLKKFENDCLDRLWWARITQLCNKRAHLYKDIAQKAKDLREATTAAFKAETLKDQQALELERQRSDDVLRKEMGYSDDAAPDISDKAQMTSLRAARSPDLFAPWAKKTAKYIRQSHGLTPWGGDE